MIQEDVKMSIKEADRLGVMRQIDRKALTIRKAGEQLGVSARQLRRIRKRYLRYGEKGLISKKRGQPSSNKTSKPVRDMIIDLIRLKYVDFGPTLACEKLYELHQIKLSRETLRGWMIEEGIWKSKKKKEKRVYQRRPRRSRFGELLQGDGSHHDWFEGRAPKCCLTHFIDDATNEITSALFTPTETTEGYLQCLKEHLGKHGMPLGLYVDKHGIFKVNREELKKGTGITHFGRVMKDLGIELICANSAQAKGRVERSNGLLQDRLIKEMRLEGINSIEEGNLFMEKFIKIHNKRFMKEAASKEDAHRPTKTENELDRIFKRKDVRKISKDLTFQHHGILYLLESKTPNRLRHGSVNIFWRGNEPIEVEYNGTKLKYQVWEERTYEQPPVLDAKEIGADWVVRKQSKPSRQHPWR